MLRLILHRTVGADIAPSGPARWECHRLLPICRPDGPETPSIHREPLTKPKIISETEFGWCRRLLPMCRPDGPGKPSSHREPLTKPTNISKPEFLGCRRLLPICRPAGPENPSSHRELLTRPKIISKAEFVGCRRLLPICRPDGPQSVQANLLSCLSSTFAVIASESTKQAAIFPADQPQKHSLFVL